MLIDLSALETSLIAQIDAVPEFQLVYGIADEEDVQRQARRKPAAGVLFAGLTAGEPRFIGHPVGHTLTLEWLVYVIAEGLRGPTAGRHGAVGAYKLADLVMQQLVGWEIVDGFPLYLRDADLFDLVPKQLAAYRLRFSHDLDYIENGYGG